MKQPIYPFENIFAVISLLFFSQSFFLIILGGDVVGTGDVDSVLLRVVFLGIYFTAFVFLALRWKRTLAFLGTNVWLLFLITLAIVSVSWSSVPDVALRKIIALVGTTFFGIYLGSNYSFTQQLRVYGWVFGISILFSFMFVLAIPEYGIMNTDAITGAWRGIYPHKNGLGESMFISFLTFYFLANSAKRYQLLFKICALLSVILIYFGESATALISVVFVFLIYQGLKHLSLESKQSVLFILLFLIAVLLIQFLILANFNAFLSANDKDITLSGRTILWDSLWGFIREKPLLGYGYGSFFSGLHRETDLLWKVHTWSPVHAHNGYIQILLNLGVVGLLTLMIGYFSCLFTSLFKYLVSKNMQMMWIFLLLIYTVFLNLTEVSFFSVNSIVWVTSVASIYSIKKVIPAK